MASLQTPGVYVQEISTLPPSVAEVSTAIPAFLGYTEKGSGEVVRVDTLLEYEATFGGSHPTAFAAETHVDEITGVDVLDAVQRSEDGGDITPAFLMHYCLSHYFKNGGGACYVVSIGDYGSTPSKADFEAGLAKLEQEDEPTLILLTDAVRLDAADYYDLAQQALAQCNKLQDRFTVLDVPHGENIEAFRTGLASQYLMYGAVYHPYLETTLNYFYRESGVTVDGGTPASSEPAAWHRVQGDDGITITQMGSTSVPSVRVVAGEDIALEFSTDPSQSRLAITNTAGKTGSEVLAAWDTWVADSANDAAGFALAVAGNGTGSIPHTSNAFVEFEPVGSSSDSGSGGETLAALRSRKTGLYNQIKKALSERRVVLPPSAAMAGIYARVDRDRGVWRAPANVPVMAVLGPVNRISHDDQASLNVDPTAGKSINAIRAFTGKGTLVWGARTLAGNDNEWRYVPVRRLFIMIEESAKKSTSFAVFEPNDATTWLKVKGMIESFLYSLWERGALQGSTPEAAYFVNVGLGKTMTAQDILEGRMIVEIGVAAVRPAEFIVLRFSHKLAES